MIVDPDFLDHWRTRMLVDTLGGDEFAPFYLMRLWGHCQVRRGTRFDIPAAGLKALCKAAGDAKAFEQALTECGYIQRDGDSIEVLKWAEQNASLIAAWENGGKGGRPSKPKPKANPDETHGKPTGNPADTQGEPIANPGETDKRGVDKTGEEGEKKPSRKRADLPCPEDVNAQVWDDWLTLRRKKSAPVTTTTVEGARAEAAKAGMTLTAFLRVWCTRGSQGLEAEWLKPAEKSKYQTADAADWWDSQSGVERKASELGIAKWGGTMQEQWPVYLARVKRAAKEREEPAFDLSQLAAMAAHQKGQH